MKSRLFILIVVFVISFAAFAEKKSNDSIFMTLDRDNNGMITKDEVSSVKKLVDDWSKIDTDQSGSIEKAEFAALDSADAYIPEEAENEPIGAAPMK